MPPPFLQSWSCWSADAPGRGNPLSLSIRITWGALKKKIMSANSYRAVLTNNHIRVSALLTPLMGIPKTWDRGGEPLGCSELWRFYLKQLHMQPSWEEHSSHRNWGKKQANEKQTLNRVLKNWTRVLHFFAHCIMFISWHLSSDPVPHEDMNGTIHLFPRMKLL